VTWVAVAEEQADRAGINPGTRYGVDSGSYFIVTERHDNIALAADPLIHFEHQVARDRWVRLGLTQIEHAAAELVADLKDIAKALRDNEGRAGQVTFQNRVGRHSRSVREQRERMQVDAVFVMEALESIEYTARRVLGCARDLLHHERAIVATGDEDIREGAANVDTEESPHPVTNGFV
jgi:hypothetical protein